MVVLLGVILPYMYVNVVKLLLGWFFV